MDPKHIEMVDQVVSGYAKVKSLYQDNKAMIGKAKLWYKNNKTKIIIAVVVLGAIAVFVYRQYQASQVDQAKAEQKIASGKKKTALSKQEDPEDPEIVPED